MKVHELEVGSPLAIPMSDSFASTTTEPLSPLQQCHDVHFLLPSTLQCHCAILKCEWYSFYLPSQYKNNPDSLLASRGSCLITLYLIDCRRVCTTFLHVRWQQLCNNKLFCNQLNNNIISPLTFVPKHCIPFICFSTVFYQRPCCLFMCGEVFHIV